MVRPFNPGNSNTYAIAYRSVKLTVHGTCNIWVHTRCPSTPIFSESKGPAADPVIRTLPDERTNHPNFNPTYAFGARAAVNYCRRKQTRDENMN